MTVKHYFMTVLLVTLLALPALAAPMGLDALIQGLQGDNAARVRARQLLPREGVDALPKLIPLVDHKDAETSYAALRVIEDILSEASTPGLDEDRARAAALTMGMIAPGVSPRMKKEGLALLPYVVTNDTELAPLAALLDDADWCEKAIGSLREIGTEKAAQAMSAALAEAEGDKAVALLLALARLPHDTEAAVASKLESTTDPKVKVAAALALATTGNAQYLPALLQVWRDSINTPTHKDSVDALLALTAAMGEQGGYFNKVLEVYRALLAEDSKITHKNAALAGLGCYGDDSVTTDILAALNGNNGADQEPGALEGLRHLDGRAGNKALLALFDQVSESMQYGLIFLYAEKEVDLFVPLLNELVQGDNTVFRPAALTALLQSKTPAALVGVIAVINGGTDAEKNIALDGLTALARTYSAQGQGEAAGRCYLELFRNTTDEGLRATALEGIKQYPVPEAFDVVLGSMAPEELQKVDTRTLAGFVKGLYAMDRSEQAEELFTIMLKNMDSAGELQSAMEYLLQIQDKIDLSARLGVVKQWHIVGPFPWKMAEAFTKEHIDVNKVDLNATIAIEDKTVQWKASNSGHHLGLVELTSQFGTLTESSVYGYTRINVPEACEGQVRCGSDDGIKVWVNGVAVHENNIDRGAAADQDIAPASFKAGDNEILIQCTQGGGGWNYMLRLTRADGTPLTFTYAE